MSIKEVPQTPGTTLTAVPERMKMNGLEQSQTAENITPEYMQRRLQLLTDALDTSDDPGAANRAYVNHLKKMRMLRIPYDTSIHTNE